MVTGTLTGMDTLAPILALLIGLAIGAIAAWLAARSIFTARMAATTAERDVLTERVHHLESASSDSTQAAQALIPLNESLRRVEAHVTRLETERARQVGAIGARLDDVVRSTERLGTQTTTLAGALNSSTVRGTWGEAQLRRVLEHAGMLSRCDFTEQAPGTTVDDDKIRPDVVIHLPGDKHLVVDSKVPMQAFLQAQDDELDPDDRAQLMAKHAANLRARIRELASKKYWTAFNSPEMVVCFVPSEAVLADALRNTPDLYDEALRSRVVLASPATLLALARTVAHTWQQDAITASAEELLSLGKELYSRLGTFGQRVTKLGNSLNRSVEDYNAAVASLETRVLVTARKMHDLDIADQPLATITPINSAPRALSAPELRDHGPTAANPHA